MQISGIWSSMQAKAQFLFLTITAINSRQMYTSTKTNYLWKQALFMLASASVHPGQPLLTPSRSVKNYGSLSMLIIIMVYNLVFLTLYMPCVFGKMLSCRVHFMVATFGVSYRPRRMICWNMFKNTLAKKFKVYLNDLIQLLLRPHPNSIIHWAKDPHISW